VKNTNYEAPHYGFIGCSKESMQAEDLFNIS